MSINEEPLIDTEIEDDFWDIHDSPFFADFDSNIPGNPIGFSIPRPHGPIIDPIYTREIIAHLKKLIELSEPI
mgnify:CR=1 FL=1